MAYKVEALPSPQRTVTTRAHWDEETPSLYYVDVDGAIMRYDPKENKVHLATIDGESETAFIIPVENTTKTGDVKKFAVGLGKRVGIVSWDGKAPKATVESIVFEVDEDKPNNVFNAAKADPTGRFYGGTMRSSKVGDIFEVAIGALYKYDGDGVRKLVQDVFISNGLAWDETINKLYYIDTGKFDVKSYDWNPFTGDISNERVVIDFSDNGKNPGYVPDGLTIDTDGNLYVTFFRGSKVYKVDPKKGEVLLNIPIPAKQVTSITFGGKNLDVLYVTTAALEDTDNKQAGRLFKITNVGATGFAGTKVRL